MKCLPRSVARALVALTLIVTSAAAQTWTGPDASRRPHILGHAIENYDIAYSEVCFPYLLQGADQTSWGSGQRLIMPTPSVGPLSGLDSYAVGGSSPALVGVGTIEGLRQCTVVADRAAADAYLAALDTRLATLGRTFSESAERRSPGEFAIRRTLCSAPGENPALAVLISAGSRTSIYRRGGRTVVTLVLMPTRFPECDAPPQSDPPQ